MTFVKEIHHKVKGTRSIEISCFKVKSVGRYALNKRVPIILFAVALVLRVVLTWYHFTHGINGQIPGTLYPYADFEGYVQPQLAYLAQGLLPYRDFAYSLTPLFLYCLYPFYAVGGLAAATAPILLADAVVPMIVYLFVKNLAGSRIALAAGLAYALSPLALFYEGFIWMDSEPALLFALLSLYLLQQKRPSLSAITLGVAVLFNQSTLALIPVPILWHLREGRAKLPRSSLLFVLTFLAGSLPFLLLIPAPYLKTISYGLLGALTPGAGFHYVGGGGFTPITNSTQIASFASLGSLEASGTCSGLINIFTVVETCASNGTIYYSVNYAQGLLGALGLFSDKVGALLIIALAILLIPALWTVRRAPNSYLLASAFTSMALLVAFSLKVHPIYRYYLLLPYAILLASTVNWKMLLVPIVAMIVSVFTPEGNFQLILVMLTLLACVAVQGESKGASLRVIGRQRSKITPAEGAMGQAKMDPGE